MLGGLRAISAINLIGFLLFRAVFSFPHPVNEKAARVVAGVVMVVALVTLATSAYWLLVPLAYGFWARVLTGPTLSPLGQFATRVAAPRLGEPKYVAGPPKRFAQGMGAVDHDQRGDPRARLRRRPPPPTCCSVLLVVAAALESIFAFCLGCQVFGLLMRAGLVPDDVCVECANLDFNR